MDIWRRVELTDPSATKKFTRGGGFSGTAINPTWQYQVITALFGPCGIGWGYHVLEEKLIEGHSRAVYNDKGQQIGNDRTVIHQMKVRFWYRYNNDEATIDSYGVTTMIGSNKNGPFTDEEAPKKSLTDAITGALQKLGVAADVFRGYWDDNKYAAWRMQEEAQGRGTVDQLAGPKIAETTKQLAAPKEQPSSEEAARLAEIAKAHTMWGDKHKAKIDAVTKEEGWAVLGPLLDEVSTYPDLPESIRIMLRASAQAKVTILGPRPK